MQNVITGGCKCGLVRYSGAPKDVDMFRCHCRDCQQLTGGGHSEMMPMELDSFSISNARQIFEMTGGSGQSTYSSFCPNCSSPLTRQSERISDRIDVHAASLDDPSSYAPAKSIYSEDAQHWDDAIIVDGG